MTKIIPDRTIRPLTMRFGLDEATIEKLSKVFEANPKVDKALVFGSRAKGNYCRRRNKWQPSKSNAKGHFQNKLPDAWRGVIE